MATNGETERSTDPDPPAEPVQTEQPAPDTVTFEQESLEKGAGVPDIGGGSQDLAPPSTPDPGPSPEEPNSPSASESVGADASPAAVSYDQETITLEEPDPEPDSQASK
jgi:hypothetical protein